MNRKGFTLIEILAVIIILGVIMTIAVPNVLSMVDRNKKDTVIEHAKMMATQAEYTIRKDTSIEYPTDNNAIILTLEYLNTNDISESPYNTNYHKSRSFVAVVNETKNNITEYKYYVHLVACGDDDCSSKNVKKNRGINLIDVDDLTGSARFNKVVTSDDVVTNYVYFSSGNNFVVNNNLASILGVVKIQNVYNKLP